MNNSDPLILVTNDDGIRSPGLIAAVEAVLDLGTVLVAAPTEQQTARGRSLVGNGRDRFHLVPMEVNGVEVTAYHLEASPALVVRHALAVLCPNRQPDLVVSGINYGENLGSNITISGTIGAAFQAAAAGIPSIAVSRQTEIEHHFVYGELEWEDSIRVTNRVARMLLSAGSNGSTALPFDVLKVDIPHECPAGTEERLTRLSRRSYFHSVLTEPTIESTLSDCVTTITVDPDDLDPTDDIYAVAVDGVVSITPLSLDCTGSMDVTRQLLDAVPAGDLV